MIKFQDIISEAKFDGHNYEYLKFDSNGSLQVGKSKNQKNNLFFTSEQLEEMINKTPNKDQFSVLYTFIT